MATWKDNEQFTLNVLKSTDNLLDQAIDYIRQNIKPEFVYDKEQLKKWAEENGYKQE